jgi:hypothetical protein
MLPERDRERELGGRTRRAVPDFAFHGPWPEG